MVPGTVSFGEPYPRGQILLVGEPMAQASDAVVKLYEGALRALDTKSQIFLAFIAITMTPVFNRLDALGAPFWIKASESVLVAVATLAFVLCLLPRRGQRSQHGVFDTSLPGEKVRELLQHAESPFDLGETVATLHDIYRIKTASVTVGTGLIALYLFSVAASFVLA